MSMEKTAAFLADCLSHMPKQTGEIKVAVDTVKAGLTLIADGGEWPEDEAWAAAWAAADASTDAAADAAAYAADAAARAHPNPDKERARQAKVREELGL